MQYKHYFLTPQILLLWLSIHAQQGLPAPSVFYHIQGPIDTVELPQLDWILEEGNEALTVDDLKNNRTKDATLLDLRDGPKFPIKAHRNYWLQLQLRNSAKNHPLALALKREGNCWPWEFTFKSVEAYVFDEQGNMKNHLSGSKFPAAERDYPTLIDPSLIQLDLPENSTRDIWVRLSMAEACELKVDLSLMDEAVVSAPLPWNIRKVGHLLLFGSIVVLFLIALALYLWTREVVYVWFIIFQVFMFASSFPKLFQNEVYSLLFSENPRSLLVIRTYLDGGLFMALIQFAKVYIGTASKFPRIHRALSGVMLTFLLLIIMGTLIRSFPNLPATTWFAVRPVFVLASLLTALYSFIYLVFSKDQLARFFCLGAIVPYLGSLTAFAAMNMGQHSKVLDVELFNHSGMVLTLTLALAYRFRLLSGQKEAAVQEKLKAEAEKLHQLEKLNAASAKFVPSAFLHFLGKQNILEATLGDYVEKQVTVLFSDIRDFTSLSENMTPEENFHFIRDLNQLIGPIIQKNGGFVNQYLGDGLMAIFPEQGESTLRAAIGMQHILQKYNGEKIPGHQAPIRMGIGLHAGPLIMGIIGDEQRMDAATISDTVNAASRVEGLTKYFGANILISEDVVQKLKHPDNFNLRYLGMVQVKGRTGALRIYECFDGDSEVQQGLKKATLNDFKKAVECYYGRMFAPAVEHFAKVKKVNGDDQVTHFFLQKLSALQQSGLPADWNGVERVQHK